MKKTFFIFMLGDFLAKEYYRQDSKCERYFRVDLGPVLYVL